ncbi:MAG: sulfatase [bacterium]
MRKEWVSRLGRGKVIAVIAAVLAVAVAAAVAVKLLPEKEPETSVFLIIIDTLPAGHVSCYGYERSTTYHLDRLADDGVMFKNAVSASPWTLPSIAGILTGVIPYRHQAGLPHQLEWPRDEEKGMSRMKPGISSMAETFQQHGFKTAGFFNNPYTHPDFGMNKGFDTYDYVGGDELEIREAGEVIRDAALWLKRNPEGPYFMVLHFFDPHLAYDPPPSYAAPYIADYDGPLSLPYNPELGKVRAGEAGLSAADKEFIRGAYDGEVVATDKQLGLFIDHLKKKGLYDNSFVIVTSDHGEEFWEHGGFEHGHSLHREVIQVPLVMKLPGGKFSGKTVEEYVSLLDIFPTLAEYFRWRPPMGLEGVSLYPKGGKLWVPPHQVVSMNMLYGEERQCIYNEGYKMIVNRDTGRVRVYNLEEDPEETANVFGEQELPEGLQNQVEKIADDLYKVLHSDKPTPAEPDPETVRKLKSLGYWGGSASGDTAEK